MWQHLIVDYLWQQDYPNARKDKMTPKCIRLGFWFFQHVETQDTDCVAEIENVASVDRGLSEDCGARLSTINTHTLAFSPP